MAWRIVEKAGLPGWAGLGAILLTLTGIGSIVPLVLLWVFAFMRWPRDEPASAVRAPPCGQAAAAPAPPHPRLAGAARGAGRPAGLAAERQPAGRWRGRPVGRRFSHRLCPDRRAVGPANELSVPDPSIGQPHARLLIATGRLGLEDLGTAGGTFIDGARLLPEHGPRDISAARSIRLGAVELALSRA